MAAIRISVKGPWSFAVGLGVSVIIMEAALHLTEATPAWRVLPVVERQLGWPDPDQGYAFRPNQSIINVRENRAIATTNSFGIRDRETVLEKAAGLTRVALMGDSRTEALQVGDDQSFDTLAEHLLNEAAGRRQYEILNLAMSGAGPLRMYFQLTERGLQFDPDIAIFVMSIGDFLSTALGDDSKNPGYVLDESGKLTIGYGFRQRRSQRLRDEPIGRLFFWLMDRSRVALAIYAKQRKEIGGDVFRPGRVTTVSPRPSPCELVEAKLADNLDLWRDGRPELQARRLERYLEDVGALAAENRLPTVFIFRRLAAIIHDSRRV